MRLLTRWLRPSAAQIDGWVEWIVLSHPQAEFDPFVHALQTETGLVITGCFVGEHSVEIAVNGAPVFRFVSGICYRYNYGAWVNEVRRLHAEAREHARNARRERFSDLNH